MKKVLLTLVALIMATGIASAQNELKMALGIGGVNLVKVTPYDYSLTYNSSEGCYEGVFNFPTYYAVNGSVDLWFYQEDEDGMLYYGADDVAWVDWVEYKNVHPLALSYNQSNTKPFEFYVGSYPKSIISVAVGMKVNLDTMEVSFSEVANYTDIYGTLSLDGLDAIPSGGTFSSLNEKDTYLYSTYPDVETYSCIYDVPKGGMYVFIGSSSNSTTKPFWCPSKNITIEFDEDFKTYEAIWQYRNDLKANEKGGTNFAYLATPGYTKITFSTKTRAFTAEYLGEILETPDVPEPDANVLYLSRGSSSSSGTVARNGDDYLNYNEATGKYEGTILMERSRSFSFYTGSYQNPVWYGMSTSTTNLSNLAVSFETQTEVQSTVAKNAPGGFYVSNWQYGIPASESVAVSFTVDLNEGTVLFSVEPYVPSHIYVWQFVVSNWQYVTELEESEEGSGIFSGNVTVEDQMAFILNQEPSNANQYALGAYSFRQDVSLDPKDSTSIQLMRGANNATATRLMNQGTYKLTFDVSTLQLTIENLTETGVWGVEADEAESVYFDLQGRRVVNPERGVYVKVAAGKAVKVIK